MENTPPYLKNLKLIKECLDKLMANRGTAVEIRSNELYDHISKNPVLRKSFPTPGMFNHFLKTHHNDDILKQIIPNYRVDTSNKDYYQWYFFKEIKKDVTQGRGIETIGSKLNYQKDNKNVIARDGTKFRSGQEVEIYNRLLKCNYLTVEYEPRLVEFGEHKYPDFRILNKLTQKKYYWEHFGQTNSDTYLNGVPEKIEWYINNGYKTVEDGGELIYTIYSDDNAFQRDLDNYIAVIIK